MNTIIELKKAIESVKQNNKETELTISDLINSMDIAQMQLDHLDTWYKKIFSRSAIKTYSEVVSKCEKAIKEGDDNILKNNQDIVDWESEISEIKVSMIERSPFTLGQEFYFVEDQDKRVRPVILYGFDVTEGLNEDDILVYKVYDVQKEVIRTIYKSDFLLDKLGLISYIESLENVGEDVVSQIEENDWASDKDRDGRTDEMNEKIHMLENWMDHSAVLDMERSEHHKERYDFSDMEEDQEKIEKDWHQNRAGMEKFLGL